MCYFLKMLCYFLRIFLRCCAKMYVQKHPYWQKPCPGEGLLNLWYHSALGAHLIFYRNRLRTESWLVEQAVKDVAHYTVRSWFLGNPSTRTNGVGPKNPRWFSIKLIRYQTSMVQPMNIFKSKIWREKINWSVANTFSL